MSPIAPCVDGEFTIILPAFIVFENFNIVALSSECITAECPNPPYSSNFSAFDIPSSGLFTI